MILDEADPNSSERDTGYRAPIIIFVFHKPMTADILNDLNCISIHLVWIR
jgi:hypothetical protein